MKRMNTSSHPEPPMARIASWAAGASNVDVRESLSAAREGVGPSRASVNRGDSILAPQVVGAGADAGAGAGAGAGTGAGAGAGAGAPSPSSRPAPLGRSRAGRQDIESWIGRTAVSAVAAILVLLGLAVFGRAIVPQLADIAKVALMFALSGALTAAGGALAIRRKDAFTMALLGCGAGALFVSILATHLYFGLIGAGVALSLVLAWMLACLAMAKRLASPMLLVVLQVGLAISMCVGYAADDAQILPLLSSYQLAATAIAVGGNALLYPKMYRPSLLLGIVLSLTTSAYMWECHRPFFVQGPIELHAFVGIVATFAMQLATATSLAGLIVAAELGETGIAARPTQSSGLETPAAANGWLVAAALGWVASLRLCLYDVIVRGLLAWGPWEHAWQHIFVAATAVMAALIAAAALMLAARRPAARPAVNALVACGAAVVGWPMLTALFMPDAAPLAWLWAWAIVAIALCRITGARGFKAAALVLVALDAAYLTVVGFSLIAHRLGNPGAAMLGALYVVGLAGFAGWLMRSIGTEPSCAVVYAAACTALFMVYLHHCTPLASEGYQFSVCLMACALVSVAAGFKFDIGGVRLYGLILALVSVAKLATVDVIGADSLERACALVVGGLVCFGISAFYNYAVKRAGRS